MNARFLLGLFDSVYVIALTAWVGGILVVTFVVAPLIFRVLGAEAGARFARALFPRYYTWGAIAGAVALPALVGAPLSYPEFRGPAIGLQALALIVGTLIMLYAGNSLTPALVAARDAGPEGAARRARLQRRSVWLNGLALVLGLGLLVAFANRPGRHTTGIIELTPLERELLEAKVRAHAPAPPQSAPAPGR